MPCRGATLLIIVSAERRDNLMAPVSDLHRTRGSFDNEAANRALAAYSLSAASWCLTFGAGLPGAWRWWRHCSVSM